MISYTGINHLALVTDDMDKTIRFWRDLLGMRMIAATGDGVNRQYFFELSATDAIAFFEWPDAVNPEAKDHGAPTREPLAFDHVAIGVETESELDTIRELLTNAGFDVSPVINHGFIKSVYSFDPNNIPIEFCWDVHGNDLRTRPRKSDRNPCDAGKEGIDPQPGKWPGRRFSE